MYASYTTVRERGDRRHGRMISIPVVYRIFFYNNFIKTHFIGEHMKFMKPLLLLLSMLLCSCFNVGSGTLPSASGLKQLDVAKILGMKSSSRISRWENGDGVPNIVNVFKLSILYGVMVDSLFIDLIRQLRSEIHINEKKYLKNKNKKL